MLRLQVLAKLIFFAKAYAWFKLEEENWARPHKTLELIFRWQKQVLKSDIGVTLFLFSLSLLLLLLSMTLLLLLLLLLLSMTLLLLLSMLLFLLLLQDVTKKCFLSFFG